MRIPTLPISLCVGCLLTALVPTLGTAQLASAAERRPAGRVEDERAVRAVIERLIAA